MRFDLWTAILWIERLIAIAIIFQSVELIQLRKKITAIWGKDVLPSQVLRLLCCLGTLVYPDPFFCLGMLLGTTLTFRTFAGSFNGGSDAMTFNILICLSIARLFSSTEIIPQIAIGYLALQLVMSYFLAGFSKLRKSNWRNGIALKNIFGSPFYEVPTKISRIALTPAIWKTLALIVLVFEILFPLALTSTTAALVFVSFAFIFHLGNFWALGLNRFVFAWLAAYPALFWLVGLR